LGSTGQLLNSSKRIFCFKVLLLKSEGEVFQREDYLS